MKKILFLNPPNAKITEPTIAIEPIDIIQLASFVQDLGHTVKFLDLDREWIDWYADVIQIIKVFQPEIVVILFDYHIPLHLETTRNKVLELANIAQNYNIKVVVWWKMATYQPKQFLFEDSGVDVAISFAMEKPLEQICLLDDWSKNNFQKIDNISYFDWEKVARTTFSKKIIELDHLPMTDRGLIDTSNYIDVRTILSSRGCTLSCKFCHVPGFWGRRVGRLPESVVDEIQDLVDRFWAKKVLFLDDNATVNKERMAQICHLLINRNVHVRLWCLSTIYCYDPELMQLMYMAWFRRIHYGVETVNVQLSQSIWKFLTPGDIERVIKWTQAIGMRVRTSRILDLPGITAEMLRQTCDSILQLQPDEVRLHFLSLRMWSKYYQEFVGDSDVLWTQYIHHNQPNYALHQISPDEFDLIVSDLLHKLEQSGYLIVDQIEKNALFHDWDENKLSEQKIVSLCPLRYWIGRLWKN